MIVKKELKLGIFVIVVLLAAIAIVNFLRGEDILGRDREVSGYFDDLETLVASAPVHIRGYVAGRVDKVAYVKDKDMFRVTCSINKNFDIPQDSRMVIFSTGIMGGKAIRIELGKSDNFLEDGDEIATGSEKGLVESLTAEFTPILNKLNRMMDSLDVSVSRVNAVINEENRRNLSNSMEHLENTLKAASSLASSVNGKSADIEEIISNLKNLSERLEPIATVTENSLSNIDGITGKINDSDLKGTITNLKDAVHSIDSTVTNIQEPLNSLLNETDELIKMIKENSKKYLKISVF